MTTEIMTTKTMPGDLSAAFPGQALPWPRFLASGIFLVLTVIVFATFQDYGISWDERLQNTYGEKLLSYYTSGFQDRSAFSYINLFLYGGFFDLVAAIANLVSPFGIYETRHLLGGLIFIAGLWGGWRLTRLLAGERAAVIALACLATTPLLYGHGFINPKDSPLAWLGIWTTYFVCRILGAGGMPSWGVTLGFAVSLGLAVGTRVIGVAYLDYLAIVLVAAAIARHLKGEPWRATALHLRAGAGRLAAAIGLALVTMALVWPWSVQQPLNILAALRAFTHFAFYPQVLWNGELIRADLLPEDYLPGLLALQLPEYILLGLIGAAVFGAMAWRGRILTLFAETKAQQYLYVVCTAVAPIAGYLALHPTVYNGLRHFLFVVPPLVILGAIGLDRALTLAAHKHRAAGAALGLLLFVSLVQQTIMMVDLHPYEYLAYNRFAGGIRGAQGRFELDYWGTSLAASGRGLAAFLAKDPTFVPGAGTPLRVFACGDRTSADHYLPPGVVLTEVIAEADFYMGMSGILCQGPNRPSRTIFEVKRLGVPLGYVLDLRASAQP